MAPTRTCVGCRRRGTADQLVRLVARDGNVIVDERRRAYGRGAYVHRDRQCVSAALGRQSLARALRVPGSLDTSALQALTD